MVSSTPLLVATAVAAVGCLTSQVQAHGYMYLPLAVPLAKYKKGKQISSWIVQIDPQLEADWNSISDDTALIALYADKAKESGYENDVRKLLDSDANLYGADCGYSDPDADPKDPPTDGTATFSRGIAHHGPCEIWLDDTMVLHDDDCAKTFGTADYATMKSVLKPIDYSSCSASGCMLRFYWLAFQGSNDGYVWQIYKHCVPLTGPAEGQTSTATTSSASTSSNTTQTTTTEDPASEPSTTIAPSTTTDAPVTETTQAPTADEVTVVESSATTTESPGTTPSTTEKCNARKRV
ncbi:hypothetical protein PRIC1_004756 [Phytophthora ramorum]